MASPDGRRIYIPVAGDYAGIELRVLAVPEDEFLPGIRASAPQLVSRVVVDPELRWVAAVSLLQRTPVEMRQITVWDPDLLEQKQAKVLGALGSGPELVDGPCPDLDPCRSDCNGNGVTTVDEVVKAVKVALGSFDLRNCLAADSTGDGIVQVDELIGAVNNLLSGCKYSDTSAAADEPARDPLSGSVR